MDLNRATQQPKVAVLLAALAELKCEFTADRIRLVECGPGLGNGGFAPTTNDVVLCRNHLRHQQLLNDTLVHELVHAYDHCRQLRGKPLDPRDCAQSACTEIRAAALSGDCGWKQELLRGQLRNSFVGSGAGGARRCARRRATLSVSLNPHCGGARGAQSAVDGVFEECLRDRAPFPTL
tara:strand:+ start:108 stop:644 length:537 start_codon:yes stop_codon:yes gene_type:complete